MPNAFFCKNVCQHRIKLPQRGERAALGRIGFITRSQSGVMAGQRKALGVFGKQLDQRVLIQQHFRGVHRAEFARAHAFHMIEQRQVPERPGVRLAADAHTLRQPFILKGAVVGKFGKHLHAQQGGVEVCFCAVVAPGCGEHERDPGLAAGGEAGQRGGARFVVIGRRAAPGPDTAREHRGRMQRIVLFQLFVVFCLAHMVVIPVDKLHAGNHGIHGLLRGHRPVIISVGGGFQAEIHIAPHHGRKAQFVYDIQYALQMAAQNIIGLFIAVQTQMSAHAHAMSFVHTDVDTFGAVGRAGGSENLPKKRIGLLAVR